MNNFLSKAEIENLKIGGRILRNALDRVTESIRPGVSALELDQIAEKALLSQGAKPAFKNYRSGDEKPFPASLCVSINEQIVHGVPKADRYVVSGDIVSIDLGAYYGGIYTDSARTVAAGAVQRETRKLLAVTRQCLFEGIKAATTGSKIGKIGYRISQLAENNGFNVVRDLVGHGIGKKIHLPPPVPNFGEENRGPEITEGMALAIEPMLTMGSPKIKVGDDGWTISTADRSLSAHFEHTVVIENGKAVIVT